MKVYLAGPYQNKVAIAEKAAELRAMGIEVTSSWLEEPHAPNTQLHELTAEDHAKYAFRDLVDIDTADVFVLFADTTKSIIRAGRHVEFGFAIRQAIPILVVGSEFENIFHYLSEVEHFATWEDARHALSTMA